MFPKLAAVIDQGGDPVVSQEDKRKIRALLEKPWNPYLVHRHSPLTHLAREKGLCDSLFEQLAGWKPGTNMKQKYVHLHDDESAKAGRGGSLYVTSIFLTYDRRNILLLLCKPCIIAIAVRPLYGRC